MSLYKPFESVLPHKNAMTKRQMKNIRKLYNEWAREIRAEAERLSRLGTTRSLNKSRELARLYYELRNASKQLSYSIDRTVRNGASEMGDMLVRTNKRWLTRLGLSTDSADYIFTTGKNRAIMNVLSGSIYRGSIPLSSRIWDIENGHIQDIYNIIAKGMATNSPVESIAKQIERYVNPNSRFPWNNTWVNPQTGNVVRFPVRHRKVDYNATRLVRTTIQHVYQETLVELTRDNPFVTGYLWLAAGSHPCSLCLDRDGKIYSADSLPLDHPNGQCEIEPVVDYDKAMQDIEGYKNNPIDYPDIDNFLHGYRIYR